MVGPAISQNLPVYEWAEVSWAQFIGAGVGLASHIGLNLHFRRPYFACKLPHCLKLKPQVQVIKSPLL